MRTRQYLVWGPAAVGAAVALGFAGLALVAAATSSSRWDDHLITATGLLAAALLVGFSSWLTAAAWFPEAGKPRSRRLQAGFVVYLVVLGLGACVTCGISNMGGL